MNVYPHIPTDALGRAPYVLSGLLIVDAGLASLAVLARPDLLYAPAVMVGSLQGTMLVVGLIGLPVIALGLWAARRGSLPGLVAWLGGLFFVGYQGVLLLFGTPFDSLFLLYLGILSLSGWAVIAMVVRAPVEGMAARFGPGTHVRAMAGYLVVLAGLFYLLWGRAILPALLDSREPAFLEGTGMATGPGQIIDLAFLLPLTMLAAVRLWQRRSWGFFLGGALLVMMAMESLSIAADQWLGSAADPVSSVASAALAPVFLVVGIGFLAMLGLYLRGLTTRTSGTSAPLPAAR
jgi:hypothetical protein